MIVYNIFLLEKDPDGGFISDIIGASDKQPYLPDYIKNMTDYKYGYSQNVPSTDRMVRVTRYDDATNNPAETVREMRFHQVWEREEGSYEE